MEERGCCFAVFHCTTKGSVKSTRREANCFAGGGGDGTEAHWPNPPLRAGRGVWAGAALPAVPGGGGGPTPTSMPQNDPHVALIILTTHMRGKIFS